ncbi:MAG: hypothetical protein K1Y36_20415 [Blastocatellia bacterium]|nr:hypothetical protein [Blastocatellia bacterium]
MTHKQPTVLSRVGSTECLLGDETVTIQSETGAHRVLSLSLLFAEQLALHRVRHFQAGGKTELIYKPTLHALAVDMREQKPVWKPVRYLFQRPYEGRLIEVRTNDSRSVTVTEQHPMLVFEGGQLKIRPAAELRPGDRIPLYWQGTVATIPVKITDARHAATTVYSMEVDEAHTFATSFGIYVHNCIPFRVQGSGFGVQGF